MAVGTGLFLSNNAPTSDTKFMKPATKYSWSVVLKNVKQERNLYVEMFEKSGMRLVFCSENYSDLLWEKNVLVIKIQGEQSKDRLSFVVDCTLKVLIEFCPV